MNKTLLVLTLVLPLASALNLPGSTGRSSGNTRPSPAGMQPPAGHESIVAADLQVPTAHESNLPVDLQLMESFNNEKEGVAVTMFECNENSTGVERGKCLMGQIFQGEITATLLRKDLPRQIWPETDRGKVDTIGFAFHKVPGYQQGCAWPSDGWSRHCDQSPKCQHSLTKEEYFKQFKHRKCTYEKPMIRCSMGWAKAAELQRYAMEQMKSNWTRAHDCESQFQKQQKMGERQTEQMKEWWAAWRNEQVQKQEARKEAYEGRLKAAYEESNKPHYNSAYHMPYAHMQYYRSVEAKEKWAGRTLCQNWYYNQMNVKHRDGTGGDVKAIVYMKCRSSDCKSESSYTKAQQTACLLRRAFKIDLPVVEMHMPKASCFDAYDSVFPKEPAPGDPNFLKQRPRMTDKQCEGLLADGI